MSTNSPPNPSLPLVHPLPTVANQSQDARKGLHALCAIELYEHFSTSLFASLLLSYLNEWTAQCKPFD